MKTILLTLAVLLLINGCTCKDVIVPNKVYCPYIKIVDTNFTVSEGKLINYYVSEDDEVDNITGTDVNYLINRALTYKGYLYNATEVIDFYEGKINYYNINCVHPDDVE